MPRLPDASRPSSGGNNASWQAAVSNQQGFSILLLAGLAARILQLLDHAAADPLETPPATAATGPTQPTATLSFSRVHFAI